MNKVDELYPYEQFMKDQNNTNISKEDYLAVLTVVNEFIEGQNILIDSAPRLINDDETTVMTFRIDYTPTEAANFSWLLSSDIVNKDLDKSHLIVGFMGTRL